MAILSSPNDDLFWVKFGSAPLIVTLILPIIIGVVVLLKCLFNQCCARSTPKEEMFGLEGRMTILPTDTSYNVNNSHHLGTQQQVTVNYHSESVQISSSEAASSSAPLLSVESSKANAIAVRSSSAEGHQVASDSENIDLNGSLKRTTLHRQLPDLPIQQQQLVSGGAPRRSSSILSHDGNSSELYATVGDDPNPNPRPNDHYSKISSNSRLKSDPSKDRSQIEPAPSSDSETYATSQAHHPYAKLKRNPHEHPYAKVKKSNDGGAGRDEGGGDETDTDTYDTAQPPQPYASSSGRLPGNENGAGSSRSRRTSQPEGGGHSNENEDGANANDEVDGNPMLLPRRPGRHWRRNSQPPPLAPNVDQANFSGDSQDSRGYTSISVREPLSNLRVAQASRPRSDPNYATVSDDSEEMYAAIDDPENNYMRIDENSRHQWGSPIPERREANSPLPPPPIPAVPPSHLPLDSGENSSEINANPPVYAQVAKKAKKVSPLATQSTSQQPSPFNPPNSGPTHSNTTEQPSTSTKSHPSNSSNNRSRHTIGDALNLGSLNDGETPRRWSKADVSYSEFEIVREARVASTESSPVTEPRHPHHPHIKVKQPLKIKPAPTHSHPGPPPPPHVLLDEGNYNVIPDREPAPIYSQSSKSKKGKAPPAPTHSQNQVLQLQPNWKRGDTPMEDSSFDNYQEIQEIDENLRSNLYQEINESQLRKSRLEKERFANRLYQEIDEVGKVIDEDEDDEFYERVKPVLPPLKNMNNHSNKKWTADSDDEEENRVRNHGYEKLRKKELPAQKTYTPPAVDDDDDLDEEEDEEEVIEDDLYEKVKFPPYERLKESKDDIRSGGGGGGGGIEDDDGLNYYEDINNFGYKAPPTSSKSTTKDEASINRQSKENELVPVQSTRAGVDQLYARVDKKRKQPPHSSDHENDNNNKISASSKSISSVQIGVDSQTPTQINYAPHHTSITKSSFVKDASTLRLDPDVSIEYI